MSENWQRLVPCDFDSRLRRKLESYCTQLTAGFKLDSAILKGVLTQDAATDGIFNVRCNLQQCNSPDQHL